VALSRGTEANFLYYWAKGRPDEDYHEPEVDQPQMKGWWRRWRIPGPRSWPSITSRPTSSATSGGLWLATGPRLR